jgi:hypothetical protein
MVSEIPNVNAFDQFRDNADEWFRLSPYEIARMFWIAGYNDAIGQTWNEN